MKHALVVLTALCAVACGASPHRPTTPGAGEVVMMEEMRIVASRTDAGDVVFDAYDAGQLFERGTRLLAEGRCREAVEHYYERIAREFGSSRYLGPALYNSGLCLQERGDLEASVPYYEMLLERVPRGRDSRHGALQLAEVLVALERWDEALPVADALLLREDLEPAERMEGLTRRAQALLGLERLEDAERQARDALRYYRMEERRAAVQDPAFAAASNYVLAETMRLRSEGMNLPPGTAEEQHRVLDRRARLLLDAQREYFNTIRHTDPRWAAAAGYRIGSMYDHLWRSLMSAPIPPPTRELGEAATRVYEDEYRRELARHIRPLLRHAIRYWELTMLMVERTGIETEWADRTRSDLERMRALLLEQTDPTPAHPGEDGGESEDEDGEPQAVLELPRALRAEHPVASLAVFARYGSSLTASR